MEIVFNTGIYVWKPSTIRTLKSFKETYIKLKEMTEDTSKIKSLPNPRKDINRL